GLARLGAYADVENGRSQAALERLGFVREGLLRRWHRHGNVAHDVYVFGLLREEWQGSPPPAGPPARRGGAAPGVAPAGAPAPGGAAGGTADVAGASSSGENGG